MILVDFNQICISNLMVQVNNNSIVIDEGIIRHTILNSMRMYRIKFGQKYGELVICCDDKNYWRRDIFPYYKYNRRKNREASKLDWNLIFNILNNIREELRTYFPYKVLQIPHAEADDIIASICHRYGELGINAGNSMPILILSSDKDFVQLQKYANVEQYSPLQRKFIICSNPARFIQEHIMKGDVGDGVPNFLSDDDVFVSDKRQKPITTKKLETWNGKEPETFCTDDMLRGYKRNQQLVDFDFIPNNIKEQTLDLYDNAIINNRSNLLNYFIQKKLKNLMESIHEF